MLGRARLQVAYRFHRHINKTDGNYAYLGNGWRNASLGSRCERACSSRDVYGVLYYAIDTLAWRGPVDIKVLSAKGEVLVYTDFKNCSLRYTNKLGWWNRLRFKFGWDALQYTLVCQSARQRIDSYKTGWRKE